MGKGIHAHGGTLSDFIQSLLRSSGYSQKELADALGLHPKVLSRKLNSSGNSHLTHIEVRSIVTILTRWHAMTTQVEAYHLLALAQVGPSLFTKEEWLSSPLNQLQGQPSSQTLSDAPNTLIRTASQYTFPAPTTRLIGREWAVDRLQQLLGQHDVRLVTLTGLGGSGKTRLALHVIQHFAHLFEHGICFVSLSSVHDAALVPMSIIAALNLKPPAGLSLMESLCTHVRNKNLLLVLDNFEQVSTAVDVVNELLAAAPGLKILVTSRSVLHLYGERVLNVPPLDIPSASIDVDASDLLHFEAIELFVERAQALMPSFTLTEENKDIVAQICTKVDGLPLAVELAAARIRVLSPTLLLKRLSNARLAILTGGAKNLPGRQQTLRNTITWSYDLLSASEQRWFPRLGIFSGGWSLEAAEAMMLRRTAEETDLTGGDAVLDMIQRLVDNSLLVQMTGMADQTRFMMLETLREYAWELLGAQEELEQWRDWHACYFLRIAENAELGLRGPQQQQELDKLTQERSNVRAALEWSLSQAKAGRRISLPSSFEQLEECRAVAGSSILTHYIPPCTGRSALEVCLRLASALRPYWEWQGYLTEGREWLSAVTSMPLPDDCDETLRTARAKALSELARLACLQHEQEVAGALIEGSIALWRELDDPNGLATALMHKAWVIHVLGNYEGAMRLYQEGLQVLGPTREPWLCAQLYCFLGGAYCFQFDFEHARSAYRQSRELFEELDDQTSVADVLKDTGGMLILEGNYNEGIACLLKSISLCYKIGHKQFVTTGMSWLAYAIGIRGEPDERTASLYTAQLQGAVQHLMETTGMTHWAKTNSLVQAVQKQLQMRVDPASWDKAWNAGKELTTEEAIELAYQVSEL